MLPKRFEKYGLTHPPGKDAAGAVRAARRRTDEGELEDADSSRDL